MHSQYIWGKVFKSGLSKFFKGCLPQNLLSPLLNTLSRMQCNIYKCFDKMPRFIRDYQKETKA